MAGALMAMMDTKFSRVPHIVELLIWETSASDRMQRTRAAVIMKIPEQIRRPIMIFWVRGSLTAQIRGMGTARRQRSVLSGEVSTDVRCWDRRSLTIR